IGTTPVTFRFRDVSGNIGAARATVTVAAAARICLLYDPTKAKNSGSTYPIRLQLCDASGRNLSSPSIVLHAVSVTQTTTNVPAALDDSGSANPDFDFRYDADLSGYIFNLSTKGIGRGSYALNFTVGRSGAALSATFAVR